jgi:cytochrome c-type biogenesis protein CcmF
LVLARFLTLLQASLPLVGSARGQLALMALADNTAVAQLVLVAIAFGALVHAYVTSDFSVLNVR